MSDKQPFAIDLNLIPPERQRRSLRLDREDRPGPAELIFWGMVLLAVLALYPLIQFWQLSNAALDQKVTFQKQLEAAVALLQTTPSPSDALRAELNRWQEQDRAWEEDYRTLVGDRVSWSQAIAAVTRSVPRGIRVDEMLQRGATQLAVGGWGASESSVFQFAANLKDSNQFSSVVIQSMVREGEPTPTLPPLSPSRTTTPPPSPTTTPTPVPTFTATATRIPTPPTATPTPAVLAVEILTVQFSPQTLPSGQLLRVDISIRNRGNVPISGQEPISGYTYDEADLPAPEVSGRFRVGVDAQNRLQLKDHPYRWGWSGDLFPGEVLTVTGYIRLVTPGSRYFWAGIVQEAIRWHQDNVGRTLITVIAPTPTSTATPEPVPTHTGTATAAPTATSTVTPLPTSTSTVTPLPTSTNTPTPVATSTATPLSASPTPTETAIPRTPAPTLTPGLSATPSRSPQAGGVQARQEPVDRARPPAAAITPASRGRLPGLAAPASQGSGVNFVILLELRRGGQ